MLDEINREARRLDAALPLLVVRQTPHEPYRRVLIALDFSPWSAQAVTLARRVAPHARLLLFNAKPGEWEPCIVEGDASQRIVEHEQEKDCDLVVLGKHGQSATEALLLGSVSKHVLAEGSTDVLVSTAREA